MICSLKEWIYLCFSFLEMHAYECLRGNWEGKGVVFGGKGVRKRSYVAPALQIKCI